MHAYGIAYGSNALLIFDRDANTGALTQRFAGACLAEDPAALGGVCTKAKGLRTPYAVVISPDGRQVYVSFVGAASTNTPLGGVATFDRNPITGDLSQALTTDGCISQDGSSGQCRVGRGLGSATSLAISPDGLTVVAGSQPIAVLQRDPTTGILSQPTGDGACVEESANESCSDGHGLGSGTRQAAFSPDGRNLYVTSSSGLNIFDRDGNGVLRQKDGTAGCLNVSSVGGLCAVEPKLNGANGAIASPDGNQIYVTAHDGVLAFSRAADGRLALQSCIADTAAGGCTTGRNLFGLSFGAISPDGQTLVTSLEGNPTAGITILERDAAGNLSQANSIDGCVTNTGAAMIHGVSVPANCAAFAPLSTPGTVTFSGDGSLIAGAFYGESVTAFKRDVYPVCQNQTVGILQNTATPLGLICSDRNGDALSYKIATDPKSGTLGAIDDASGRVFYNPFTGFLGEDSFTYRAVAAGLTSNDAKVTIGVAAPPGPPAPVTPIRTVSSRVPFTWSFKGSKFRIAQMLVRSLPTGGTVTITCSGKKCPFKSRTAKRGKSSTLNVVKAKTFKGRLHFRAKQTIEIRVAAPGMNAKVLRFKLKSGKTPKYTTYCIPLGKKKVQRTC